MKICITSQGETLESQVDPRFGRCAWFIIADTETMDIKAIRNGNAAAGGGAGIQSGQLISENGAKVVLTGNVGPNAFQTLNAAEIEIITNVSGTVKDAVDKYKNGDLKKVEGPTVDSHAGMKKGE